MKISASIVTYNSEDEIGKVLDSLLSLSLDELDIIVVDNASCDKTVEIIETQFPSVKLIKSGRNLGFGAGHNLALNEVDSDYHIFINPDITIKPGEIQKMVTFMENNPDVVVLTPKIMNSDGTEQFLPKVYPKLRYFIGGRFENKSKFFYNLRSEYTLREKNISKPTEIDFCTGCFMFCRTNALKKCGGFDERYFLHFEDADLTREMKKYGKTMYVPDIYVTHAWKRENAGSGKVFFIALQSMLKYFRKWEWSFEKR